MLIEENPEITIGELASRTGLATSAIRYYEKVGLIESARTEGGQRRYAPRAARILRSIAFAQSAGFTLSEILDLRDPFRKGEPITDRWKELAGRKLAELDDIIARAQDMKRQLIAGIKCQCREGDNCPLFDL
jgi:DNA-binding transcriptional MerR regulator